MVQSEQGRNEIVERAQVFRHNISQFKHLYASSFSHLLNVFDGRCGISIMIVPTLGAIVRGSESKGRSTKASKCCGVF